jgi:deoxyxylulose-5-phosphate synthase
MNRQTERIEKKKKLIMVLNDNKNKIQENLTHSVTIGSSLSDLVRRK